MTGSGRQKALEKVADQLLNNREKNQYLRLNWEGYHLLEFANTVRPQKNDEDGTIKLDGFLAGNSIGGFKQLQTLPSSKRTAFTTAKSKRVFESLAAFQDIPTIVCFLNFLEFCRDSNPPRPLKVFNGDDPLPPVIIDGKKIPLTLDYAIESIKKHIEEQIELEEERLKKEKLEKESSLKESEQPKAVQPLLTVPQAKENNVNYYANAVLEVIGREKEKARLAAFLDCDLDVAWFQLAGVAGQGKSRLAFDLIADTKDKPGWRAGFLTEYGIESFKDHWKDWQPDAHHLLIFDYVIGREQAIKPILQTLIYNRDKFKNKKIRILLIERQRWDQGSVIKAIDQRVQDETGPSVHIGDKAEWFLKLGEKDDLEAGRLSACRFENGVEELEKLNISNLVIIVNQLLWKLYRKKIAFPKKTLREAFERIDKLGRPLYAYLLAQQLNENPEGFQSWTKTQLLNSQLVRDKLRWGKVFEERSKKAPTWGDNHAAMKLALLATMIRKVRFQDELITKHFTDIDSSLRKEAISITSSYLINDDDFPQEIFALEPDLLGEWFVLFCINRGFELGNLLDIAWKYSPNEMAMFLQRITQDFIDVPVNNTDERLIQKLLVHCPPQETAYQALANVAVSIAGALYDANLPIPQPIMIALENSANCSDVSAMNALGFYYIQGVGGEKKSEKAIFWFRRAIEEGADSSITRGDQMINLGDCYERGDGIEQDWKMALNLYQKAYEVGNQSAIECISTLLLKQFFLTKENSKSQNLSGWPNRLPYLNSTSELDPPILSGNWEPLTTNEIMTCLDTMTITFDALGITDRSDFFGQYGRVLPLCFYKGWRLVDIQICSPVKEETFIISAILNDYHALLLDGKSVVIHELNEYLLSLENNNSAINYLTFFCSYTQGEAGPFQIIFNFDEIPFVKNASSEIQEKIKLSIFSPRSIEGNIAIEDWERFETCVLYSNALFVIVFKVCRNGSVFMENDRCIFANLPVLQRQYKRLLRTPLSNENFISTH